MLEALKDVIAPTIAHVINHAIAAIDQGKEGSTKYCPPPLHFATLIMQGKKLSLHEEEHIACCPFCVKLLASLGYALSNALAANLPKCIEVAECDKPVSYQEVHAYWQGLLTQKQERNILRHIATCDYCLTRHALAGIEYEHPTTEKT